MVNTPKNKMQPYEKHQSSRMVLRYLMFGLVVVLIVAFMGFSSENSTTQEELSKSVAINFFEIIPRSLAVKVIQGLTIVHGIELKEIDHRVGRYTTAFENQRKKTSVGTVKDASCISLSDVGWRHIGENLTMDFGTLFGYSVSMGGDVDGHRGYEVVAGGYEFSDTISQRGMVTLLSSKHPPIKIYGPRQYGAWFGHSVANNGDFDGDGLADILVGARFANHRSGAAYLFPGAQLSGNARPLETDENTNVIKFTLNNPSAELGFEVYFGDDWDRDGRNEIILRANIEGTLSGGVYVVYSSKVTSKEVDIQQDDTTIQITTGEDYADIGRTITTIGDIDGDGLDELLLGSQTAPDFFRSDRYVSSKTYIALSSSLTKLQDIGKKNLIMIEEAHIGDQFGSCVGRLGDIDQDDTADFIVGARHAKNKRGAIYLLSGSRIIETASKGKPLSVQLLEPIEIYGEKHGDLLGWSCAEAGADFDGDGIDEIAVGAREADGTVDNAGAVYLIQGSKVNQLQRTRLMQKTGVIKIGGTQAGSQLGSKRRFAVGFFDTDQIPDLAVGTPGWHEGGIFAGATWIVPGSKLYKKF